MKFPLLITISSYFFVLKSLFLDIFFLVVLIHSHLSTLYFLISVVSQLFYSLPDFNVILKRTSLLVPFSSYFVILTQGLDCHRLTLLCSELPLGRMQELVSTRAREPSRSLLWRPANLKAP